MKILLLLKMVPDVVEELDVAPDGKSLDVEFLRLIVNERDDHALEQALLLKERHDAEVIALAIDRPEVDDLLFTALAKGVDRAVKVTGVDEGVGTHGMAEAIAATIPAVDGLLPADLVLTGCQAIDDLDGMVGPLLAGRLEMPYLGLVARAEIDPAAGRATVAKEYAGGVLGEFAVSLPALLGVQAAEKPPRYVPIAKVRAAMSSGEIETVEASTAAPTATVEVLEMTKPEAAERAEILEGSPQELAGKVADMLAERGLL
jgi:electron transfer flavoprotein beta subunit